MAATACEAAEPSEQQRPDSVDGRGEGRAVGAGAQRAGHVGRQQEGAGGEPEQDGAARIRLVLAAGAGG
jgi:hypothetical protein